MNAPVLVTGASGLVGAAVARVLRRRGVEVVGTFARHEGRVPEGVAAERMRLEDRDDVRRVFARVAPRGVVHCAAVSDLLSCEEDRERSGRCNVEATDELARLCAEAGARMLFCSTDQVFDGSRPFWREEDEPRPLHEYGRQKLRAERAVARRLPAGGFVLRLALVVGPSPSGERSASERVIAALARGERPRLFTDEYRTPVHVEDVARLAAELLDARDTGLLHVGGPDRLSRYDLGLLVARVFGFDADAIEPVSRAEAGVFPPRPPDLSLNTSRLRGRLDVPVRPLAEALEADRTASGV